MTDQQVPKVMVKQLFQKHLTKDLDASLRHMILHLGRLKNRFLKHDKKNVNQCDACR